jgi:hypothetical protein
MKILDRHPWIGVTLLAIAWLVFYVGVQWITQTGPDPCTVDAMIKDKDGQVLRDCESEDDAGRNGVDQPVVPERGVFPILP